MKIRKDDTVVVTTGKDKGKSGKILQVLPMVHKVVVQSLNLRRVHQRPKRQGEKGQIITKEAPLHISNVMLICPKCAKPTRVGFKRELSGTKSRICKKCKALINL